MENIVNPQNYITLPPLMSARDAQTQGTSASSTVLKSATTYSSSKAEKSKIHMIQTADGKKYLLTKSTNNSKIVPDKLNNKQPSLSNGIPQQQLSLIISPSKSETLSKSGYLGVPVNGSPIIIQLPGSKQLVNGQQAGVMNVGNRVMGCSKNSTDDILTTMAVPMMRNSVISKSDTFAYIDNGAARFKIIGKPVPITLGKSLQENDVAGMIPKNVTIKPPVKIAPKILSGIDTGGIHSIPALKKPINEAGSSACQEGTKGKSKGLSTLSHSKSPKKYALAAPPAYLNIHIKEEPENKIKEEVEGPLFIEDLRITEDQNALLENDEELCNAINSRKILMRDVEGKLISVTQTEAEELGFSGHLEESNEKDPKQQRDGIEEEQKCSPVSKSIPDDAGVVHFVNRHVMMGQISQNPDRLHEPVKTFGKNLVSKVHTPEDGVIVGEVTKDNGRYLRIRVEMPDNSGFKLCDIFISPFNTYICPFCTKEFKVKDHVISHIRIHTGERPFPCDICGKRYRQRIDIIRHRRVHTGERPFTCEICNTTFNQKSNLRSHMRTHTGERPIKCELCFKSFSRNTHLKQHMKLHTGEKPYNCKVCQRPFRFKSGLQAHERIHAGSKPYACSLCGRSFTQIVGLIRHERSHSREKPFRCFNCGKSFDDQNSLQEHCKTHTNDRLCPCTICSSTFIDQAALRSHVKKYHSNTLSCPICHKEGLKSRIDLREHIREHERSKFQNIEDDDLAICVDDIMEHKRNDSLRNLNEDSDSKRSELEVYRTFDTVYPEDITLEVELDPDDPMENDDGQDSDYDPLAC